MVAKSTFPPKYYTLLFKLLLLTAYRQDTEILKPFLKKCKTLCLA
ncbi:hypothetical protein PAGA_a2989 [Pseudoalteromonas agarivorans DSM 14585]|uniref:Uncharacterized protein n=1 Tax=Pseudoalteromonas agarivorans DSM 14585 TaxID=1312369 RepID=A0ACA8DZ06_9GAMM|nr:hypothetical protein PAGA_a2989 [Pseudoalteromonas agarivorans DSM 14585]